MGVHARDNVSTMKAIGELSPEPMQKRTDLLVSFYAGTAPDDAGRYLRNIHIWPDARLEQTHDYIQWLFPLRERSGFSPSAPILDEAAIEAFHQRAELRRNLHTSFVRMLLFYGFTVREGCAEGCAMRVVRASSFADRARVWLNWGNHNHLRITRILKSLKLLGLGEEADAFFAVLEEVYKEERASRNPRISPETFEFWKEAVGRRRNDAKK